MFIIPLQNPQVNLSAVFSSMNNSSTRHHNKQSGVEEVQRLCKSQAQVCSLLNAKEDEELFYDKKWVVKKAKPAEQLYAHHQEKCRYFVFLNLSFLCLFVLLLLLFCTFPSYCIF